MSRRSEKILRGVIKALGLGLAAGSAYLAYTFTTVTNVAYPIFATLMAFFLALMVIGALLTILY
ncbi:MAG TPA: hypothetical protein EYH45_08235 [Candidatus Caldiarchaeum subterraneum]|uniref:Uncharacterized protein n=1 Tax=Caldiarchaeum subterraneum TaxID=311458 RepID=A0A833ECS1_CALS0|nr:hypothetical protein [Aigarchaeota archaeon]HIQ30529.1 hypothetical protein [Candidatus Caldarchaeum subterraneum]